MSQYNPLSPARSSAPGAVQAAMALCLIAMVANIALAMLFSVRNPGVIELFTSPSAARIEATSRILVDEINESPHFAPAPATAGPHPICAGVEERHVPPLIRAFALMRGTADGFDLYEMLVDNDVCVAVEDIPYNGGFATSWRTVSGAWIQSTITLDDGYLSSRQADVLAAMLVHESIHVERAITGESCDVQQDCEELPNGVQLDEEVAAHAAEAEWWIAAYGENGKRFAFGTDYGENELAAAYREGPEAFREYVREIRSDPREGTGIKR
ncbi:MAG: hypothetical protein ACRDJW_02855 [Thermomicrobiales bacterium]